MKKYISLFLFIFLFSSLLFPQPNQLKSNAVIEMQAGRYGEAIDLLNRYLSANPQEAEGYNLRGICYEKRNIFEMAVYDFRSARKLSPNNKEILLNLSRATDSWYKLLYNKIAGHKREIAINPKRPVNYLEIAKCYKSLGEWLAAEEWYDKYLNMEEASSNEIIIYTEILAKNSHIAKGEPILKRYSIKFPNDHRIWSRYGYFALWLGKTKIAIDAFEEALKLRPYFKEAMDGLDQAKGKGYIYVINDTTYKYSLQKSAKPQEYAIDAYYKEIKKNPKAFDTRYSLITELIKNSRYEEAYEQLIYLQRTDEIKSDRFQKEWDSLNKIRDSLYKANIEKYAVIFENNSSDKEAAKILSEAYAHLFDYDNSIQILEKYFENVPEEKDLDLRYILAKYSAWSYQWGKAFQQSNILLKYDPDNLNYQLLMGQLIAWNVIDSSPEEVSTAKKYLNNVLDADPERIHAVLALVFLNAGMANFDEANIYLDRARAIDPDSKELEAVINFYNTRIEVENERKILRARGAAGLLSEKGDCKGAVEKYEEVFTLTNNPPVDILLEFAAFNNCAGYYDRAVEIYTKALELQNSSEIASLRAINRVYAGDTAGALSELLDLNQKEPENYIVIYNLGELYERTKRRNEAIELYRKSIELSETGSNFLDSTQIAGLNTRIGYLQVDEGSWDPGFVFNGIGFSPISSYYLDNQDFIFYNYGMKTDLNLFAGFSLGGLYIKHFLSSLYSQKYLSTYSGALQYRYNFLSLQAGFGQTKAPVNYVTKNFTLLAAYENKEIFGLIASFEKNDARIILFSPNIINFGLNASVLKFRGYYNLSNRFYFSGYYSYLAISDKNRGNDLMIRAGRSIQTFLKLGYEYYYSNYGYATNLYYSPKNFESHSLWADSRIYQKNGFNITAGGKVGYVPSNDYVLRELYSEASYQPLPILTITAKITAGSSFRYDNSYDYLSAFISAYFSVF